MKSGSRAIFGSSLTVALGLAASQAADLPPAAERFDFQRYIRPILGGGDLRWTLRYPPVEVLHEPPGQELWMQVPFMMGGFRIMLRDGHVALLGGYRRVDDSGEVHVTTHGFVVTPTGWELVHESAT